jgi:hypothetical protein
MSGEAVAAGIQFENKEIVRKACECLAFLSREPDYHPRFRPAEILPQVILVIFILITTTTTDDVGTMSYLQALPSSSFLHLLFDV